MFYSLSQKFTQKSTKYPERRQRDEATLRRLKDNLVPYGSFA